MFEYYSSAVVCQNGNPDDCVPQTEEKVALTIFKMKDISRAYFPAVSLPLL